ncbi:MAG: hypothetical protein JXA33_24255 [Anaerolineae bacterium]|nr:hypothetical protein [Anaerolineae bacterium]
MIVYLICEGPNDGLDVRVLDLILAQKLGRLVRIKPAGGESSLRSIARYVEERLHATRAYSIADRNYTPLSEVEAIWDNQLSRHFMWHRHEIENYLLQPELLSALFTEWQTMRVTGSAGLPTTCPDIWEWLRGIAAPMLADHAGYVILHEIKGTQQRWDTRWLYPTRDTLKRLPNTRYANQEAWERYLQNESQRLQQACRSFSDESTFSSQVLLQRYTEELAWATTPSFLEKVFLTDMAGHELLWGMWQALHQEGIPLSVKQLADELLRALDTVYYPELFELDDFQNLANCLKGTI